MRDYGFINLISWLKCQILSLFLQYSNRTSQIYHDANPVTLTANQLTNKHTLFHSLTCHTQTNLHIQIQKYTQKTPILIMYLQLRQTICMFVYYFSSCRHGYLCRYTACVLGQFPLEVYIQYLQIKRIRRENNPWQPWIQF